jgi:hemoglobin/transferrin/lactoferrin receptor protein
VDAMIKKFFLSAIAISLSAILCGQILTITDRNTGFPIDGVTLVSSEPVHILFTDREGKVNLDIMAETEHIEINMLGYELVRTTYWELEEQGFFLELIPENISLDQIVISASRWDQSAVSSPYKVASLKKRDLVLSNPQTAADMLGTSGEVYIQKSQQGGGSPMIRGFAANRLLYSVDGVRMNTAIFRSGNLQNVISLDPFSIERTEILFGPGSVLYGSDALGGVMRFETLSPGFSEGNSTLFHGNGAARYASANNEITGHFDLTVSGEKIASLTSITYNRYGDLHMGSKGPEEYLRPSYVNVINGEDVIIENGDPEVQIPTNYDQLNIMQKIKFKVGQHWELDYGFHYSETSEFDRYDRLIQTRNGEPRSAEWKYGPQIWMMNHAKAKHFGSSVLHDKLTLHLAQQHFEESRIDRNFMSDVRRRRIEKVDAWSFNADLLKEISPDSRIYYGLEFVYNKVRSVGYQDLLNSNTQVPGPSRYPPSNWFSYSGYLNYDLEITSGLLLQAGVRYSYIKTASDFTGNLEFFPLPFEEAEVKNGAITGSIGIVWKPEETVLVRGSLSNGFRAPNIDDIGKIFDSAPGAVVIPNPDLQAEYAYNAEIGVAKTFGKWLQMEISGYYSYLDQAMVRRDFTLNGMDSIMYDGQLSKVQAIQNAADAYVFGMQAGVEINLPLGFSVTSRINYQRGEEELEDGSTSPSRHVAPTFGHTSIRYLKNRLEAELLVQYNSEIPFEDLSVTEAEKPHLYAVDEDGNPYAPGWTTLNVRCSYSLNEHLTVSGGIENILDKRYRYYSSGIAAAGINFILSLRASF